MKVRRVNYCKDAHKENADSIANEQGGVLSMGEIDQQAKLVTAVVRRQVRAAVQFVAYPTCSIGSNKKTSVSSEKRQRSVVKGPEMGESSH